MKLKLHPAEAGGVFGYKSALQKLFICLAALLPKNKALTQSLRKTRDILGSLCKITNLP